MTKTCQSCLTTVDLPKEFGAQPDMPMAWAVVTVAQRGQPIRNKTVCTDCLVKLVGAELR